MALFAETLIIGGGEGGGQCVCIKLKKNRHTLDTKTWVFISIPFQPNGRTFSLDRMRAAY